MGYYVQQTARSQFHFNFPWWAFVLLSTVLITVLVYRGVAISTQVMMAVGLAEMAIVLLLAISGLVHPGPGGVNLRSFLPSSAPSARGLYLAVVFTIFNFTGFESVAPMAEESRDPQRTFPRAILGSIAVMGIFFVFGSWSLLVGWGTENLASLSSSMENPCFVLARRFWGAGWVFIFLAVLNSVIGVSIAGTNTATRVLFAMSREGVLPRSLARVHPRLKTPVYAIWLQAGLTLAVGLGLGFLIGPQQEFYFMGVVMTLSLAVVYGAGNYGVFRYFRRERKREFQFGLHVASPLLSTAAMVWVGYSSVFPLASGPLRYAPFFVVAWISLGLCLTLTLRRAQTLRLPVLDQDHLLDYGETPRAER